MAITTTPRFGLPQWGAGSDSPSRVGFNGALDSLDDKAAYDDGAVGTSALPSSGVVDGRYAQTVDGAYRRFYRRAGGAWQQVGGNTWSETQFFRADNAAAITDSARVVSHPTLTANTVTESWDGSSSRGGRQTVSDLNAGQPGAVHVGEVAAVDLAVRGRVYARAAAAGQRGFVASAFASTAGNLFTARDSGNSEPWLVDSQGRMRATAPTSFGGASPVAGVAISSAPAAGGASALDLAAATSIPALRILRALGDSTPIASFAQDAIVLGRSTWPGGQVDVLGPQLDVQNALNVGGALDVNGASTLAGLTAGTTSLGATNVSSLAASGGVTAAGTVQGSALTATGGLSLHGGLVTSAASGTTSAELRTRAPSQYGGGTNQQSVRQPMVYTMTYTANLRIETTSSGGGAATSIRTVTMPEDGWMRLDCDLLFTGDIGAVGAEAEIFKCFFTVELVSTGGTLIDSSQQYISAFTSDAPERGKAGMGMTHVTEVWSAQRLTAGNYQIRLRMYKQGALSGEFTRATYTVTPVVLHASST